VDRSAELRRIPAVDDVLREKAVAGLIDEYSRPVVVAAVRRVLDRIRRDILASERGAPDPGAVAGLVEAEAARTVQPRLKRVINATGVVVHTNLGRSVLAESAVEAVVRAARHYTNLEFDLELGKRGSRYALVEGLLTELTGAESALVVNNNAAAVFLSLQTLAAGREVIVSRGQLVEIGGSFRIPDVMARSGAILVEVGATNKTHPFDYERAITEKTALLLKVHTSNFAVVGFTAEVDLPTLVKIGAEHGLPVMEDLGSGNLIDFGPFGIGREPTVIDCLEAGVDLVTFSGDKLLGGPQAGIILGRKEYLDLIKKNPLHRAVRVDKMTLAGLEATLHLYRDPQRALKQVPTLRMLTRPLASLQRSAASLARRLRAAARGRFTVELKDGRSQVGGGALPLGDLPTRLVAVKSLGEPVARIEEKLRARAVPVIARTHQERLLLDVRTMLPGDDREAARALDEVFGPVDNNT
jgi:L-seryl-tRNA(Ser) seleniumtransferase